MDVTLIDVNARIFEVNDLDSVSVYNTEVIKQQVYKLVNTEEGEIMYFRPYGLNLKQFQFYPLTQNTGALVFQHVVDKVNTFVSSINILGSNSVVELRPDDGVININLVLQVTGTSDVFSININNIIIGG